MLHCAVPDHREQLVRLPLMNQKAPLPEGGYYFCLSDHKP